MLAKESNNRKDGKFIWGGLHPFLYHPFVFHFIPDLRDKMVLDCGCGRGIYGYLIRATRPLGKGKLIGIDTNKKYLQFCKDHKVYNRTIRQDIKKLPFDDKSVDLLFCSEVIEHLRKKDGDKFLAEVDRVCRDRAIITTPNVFFQTSPGKMRDAHRSLWTVAEFKKRGYKVYGIGLKISILQNDKLFKLKQALSLIFSPISYLIPELAGFIVCVKNYDEA